VQLQFPQNIRTRRSAIPPIREVIVGLQVFDELYGLLRPLWIQLNSETGVMLPKVIRRLYVFEPVAVRFLNGNVKKFCDPRCNTVASSPKL
jgi:hypothetical protein